MSSDPSRPDSPIPDLDLEVGDWSGSEKDLASRPVETVVTTRGAGDLGQQVRQEAPWCAWRAQEHTQCLRKNCTQNEFRMAKQGQSLSEPCAVNFRSYAHSLKHCAAHTVPWRLELFIGGIRAESILARSLGEAQAPEQPDGDAVH